MLSLNRVFAFLFAILPCIWVSELYSHDALYSLHPKSIQSEHQSTEKEITRGWLDAEEECHESANVSLALSAGYATVWMVPVVLRPMSLLFVENVRFTERLWVGLRVWAMGAQIVVVAWFVTFYCAAFYADLCNSTSYSNRLSGLYSSKLELSGVSFHAMFLDVGVSLGLFSAQFCPRKETFRSPLAVQTYAAILLEIIKVAVPFFLLISLSGNLSSWRGVSVEARSVMIDDAANRSDLISGVAVYSTNLAFSWERNMVFGKGEDVVDSEGMLECMKVASKEANVFSKMVVWVAAVVALVGAAVGGVYLFYAQIVLLLGDAKGYTDPYREASCRSSSIATAAPLSIFTLLFASLNYRHAHRASTICHTEHTPISISSTRLFPLFTVIACIYSGVAWVTVHSLTAGEQLGGIGESGNVHRVLEEEEEERGEGEEERDVEMSEVSTASTDPVSTQV